MFSICLEKFSTTVILTKIYVGHSVRMHSSQIRFKHSHPVSGGISSLERTVKNLYSSQNYAVSSLTSCQISANNRYYFHSRSRCFVAVEKVAPISGCQRIHELLSRLYPQWHFSLPPPSCFFVTCWTSFSSHGKNARRLERSEIYSEFGFSFVLLFTNILGHDLASILFTFTRK